MSRHSRLAVAPLLERMMRPAPVSSSSLPLSAYFIATYSSSVHVACNAPFNLRRRSPTSVLVPKRVAAALMSSQGLPNLSSAKLRSFDSGK